MEVCLLPPPPSANFKFSQHHRHMLPVENAPHHHTARLHLRHLLSRAPHLSGHAINGHPHHADSRPRKNVSFAEVTQVANADADMGSTVAESGGEDCDQEDADDAGIMFSAIECQSEDLEEQVAQSVPMEPTAIETSLPWKRNTGRQPMSSQSTHCMPDDYHPLLGEAPSWIDNSGYTHPAPPPPCDTVEIGEGEGFDNPALDHTREMGSRDDLSSAFSGHVTHGSSMECDIDANSKDMDAENKHKRTGSGGTSQCEEGVTLPFPWIRKCDSANACCTDGGHCNNSRVSGCSRSDISVDRDSHSPATHHHHPKAHPHEHHPHTHNEMGMNTEGAMPPPPWRDLAHIGEVKRDQGAPRHSADQSQALPNDTHPHLPPLPWRHNPEPLPSNDLGLRSPSASFDLEAYSLRPQPSSHSFRLSEAESRHSEPYHYHHILDSAACSRPILELEVGPDGDLELENDDMDTHDRVLMWLRDIEPEPLTEDELNITVNDDLPNPSHEDNNGENMELDHTEQESQL